MNTIFVGDTLLFKTANGKVTYCRTKETFSIQFSNLLLIYDQVGLLEFLEFTMSLQIQDFQNICCNKRIFVLKMPERVHMMFSKNEIIELRELLNNSHNIFNLLEDTIKLLNSKEE